MVFTQILLKQLLNQVVTFEERLEVYADQTGVVHPGGMSFLEGVRVTGNVHVGFLL